MEWFFYRFFRDSTFLDMISNIHTLCSPQGHKVLPCRPINSLLRAQTQRRTKQARKTSSWIRPPGQPFWNWKSSREEQCRANLEGGYPLRAQFLLPRRHPSWKLEDSLNEQIRKFMKAMVDFQCPLIYQKVKRAVVIPKRMHQKPNRCLSQSSVMGARTKFRITTQKPDVRIILNPYEMKCTEGTHGFFVECNPSRNLRITRQQRTRGECSMYVHSSTKV